MKIINCSLRSKINQMMKSRKNKSRQRIQSNLRSQRMNKRRLREIQRNLNNLMKNHKIWMIQRKMIKKKRNQRLTKIQNLRNRKTKIRRNAKRPKRRKDKSLKSSKIPLKIQKKLINPILNLYRAPKMILSQKSNKLKMISPIARMPLKLLLNQ